MATIRIWEEKSTRNVKVKFSGHLSSGKLRKETYHLNVSLKLKSKTTQSNIGVQKWHQAHEQGNGGEEKILALENLVRINNMAVTEMEKRE